MNRPALSIAAVLSVLALAPSVLAAVNASLPLGPYCRPGRYIPVLIRADAPGTLTLAGDGVVGVRIENIPAGGAVTAPLLIAEAPRGLRCTGSAGQVQEVQLPPTATLSPTQRITGIAGDPASVMPILRQLLDEDPIVVPLDPANPLRGPAISYEMLDAIVLDPEAMRRMGAGDISDLLSAGTILAVRSDSPPDSYWPWEKRGSLHILRHALAGPRSFTYADAGPICERLAAWNDGWPRALRGRFMLLAALGGIGLLALSLLRWRWTPAAMLLAACAFSGGVHLWWRARPPVLHREGMIVVRGDTTEQSDDWIIQTSPTPGRVVQPWSGAMRPLLAGPTMTRSSDVTLVCDSTGSPRQWEYSIRPRVPMTLLSRSVDRAGHSPPTSVTAGGIMLSLARDLYLRKAWRIAGAIPPAESSHLAIENLPAIVIDATTPATRPQTP